MVRRRKRNKSSPLAESSPKKSKSYTSPQQAGLKLNSKTYRDSESETSLETLCEVHTGAASEPEPESEPESIRSIPTMQSPNLSQSQSQSLLGNVEPGPSTNPDSYASSQGGVNAPPQFINPMMLSGSLVNPGILGLSQPMPGLSDQDVIRIASLIKQMLQQEIDQIVSIKVDAATATLRSQLNDVQNRCKFLEEEVKELKVKHDDIEQYSRRMCLRISGLKEFDHEDVTAKVLDFAKKVDVNISGDDIDRAHRVGRRNTESSDADDWNEAGVIITVDSDEPVQPLFKPSNS